MLKDVDEVKKLLEAGTDPAFRDQEVTALLRGIVSVTWLQLDWKLARGI